MNYNTELFDFNSFFQTDIQKSILDNLFSFKLISNNHIRLTNKYTKQIIVDFVCFHLTKKMQMVSVNKSICIVQPYIIQNTEIENYCDLKAFQNLLRKTLVSFQKKYPKQIYFFQNEVDLKSSDFQFLIFHKANQ